ncbi:MFS transporter [Arthrobacter sp. ISL-28]|uniref:MFS transporter n=1 Tax=Arthrobacter sp. ISL-28 TaxID=2819108 RepID=UPI001BE5A9F2|nr:MFS transporter [Arthrobacter sp. ISL-28]MBT2523551.1 MFS transporter [Arthrobacter sp. ISL-28]
MPRLPQTSYRTSFAIIAATFALLTTGGTLPIPLYTLWGNEFGFGPETTTWVFAIYVFGTLLALIFFGGLSDQVGRRPLAIAALILAIASTLFFIFASSVPMLLAARFLSGVSVGLITSAATAALSELFRGRNKAFPAMISTAANMGGLGLGPLIAGASAQYLPAPTVLIFIVFISLVSAVTVLTFFVPETHARTPGAKINWTPRVGVPQQARTVYWKSAIAVVPTFTLLGLFSSLTPRFIAQTLQIHNLAVAGLATFILFEIGVTAQLLFRSRGPQWSLLRGLPLLILSLSLVLTGFLTANFLLFGAGTVLGGFGAGLAFMGGLGQLTGVVEHESHAKSVAAYFIAAQSGLAVPVLTIGALTPALGLTGATTAVIVTVIVLAAIALAINAKSSSGPAAVQQVSAQEK